MNANAKEKVARVISNKISEIFKGSLSPTSMHEMVEEIDKIYNTEE